MSTNPYETPNAAGSPPGGGSAVAQSMVAGPAIGLMVTAGVGIAIQALALVVNLLGAGAGAAAGGDKGALNVVSGGVGMVTNLVAIVLGVVVFLGAQKMKNLQSPGFAMASAIIAMIPCLSPCCVLGLPIGIWALVVLSKPEVKAAFKP